MPCHCAERRTAIGRAVRAVIRGDVRAVQEAAGFVGRTSVQDVEAMARRMGKAAPRRTG